MNSYRKFVKDNLVVAIGRILIYAKGIILLPILIKSMAKSGVLIDTGWGNEGKKERLCKRIEKLIDNYPLRKEMNKLGQRLVDGKGAFNSVKEILSLHNFKT